MSQILRLLVALSAGLSCAASAAVYQNWSVGMEREVDEGFYFKLVSVKKGWRIWRIETANDVDCRAVKSANGRIHPIPIGYGGAFGLGTPYLMIYNNFEGVLTFAWTTAHMGKEKIQYRRLGEKFWTNGEMNPDDLTQFDGEKLDIALSSWEYPEILVGYKEEKGVIDLAGMKEAISEVRACNAAGKVK